MPTTDILKNYSLDEISRSLAKSSLLHYCQYETPEGDRILYESAPAAHHRYLIEKLEAVERGEIKRLFIFMPPGSAKSTYASMVFPTWYLGRNPAKNVICASHTGDLAEYFGRRARNLVGSPAFKRVFGFGLSQETKAVGSWEVEREAGKESKSGGEYKAVGVGGGITGRRGDLGIIDDPVKGHEDADSQRIRDKQWDWYTHDFGTRLKPGASRVIIMTRWHEDDLAGRILPEGYAGESGPIECRDGHTWEVICFPAEAEGADILGRKEGELLWSDYFVPDEILSNKPNERLWSSLFQQRPTPEAGLYFKREWVRYYDYHPPMDQLHIYMASDYAVTDDGGDYTVHGVFGIDPEKNVYVLDLWRDQKDSKVWIEAFCDLVDKWHPLGAAEENGQIIKGVGPFLVDRMRARGSHCARYQFTSSTDKSHRARSWQAMMSMGMVYFPRNRDWTSALVSEHMSFPAGVNDDQVDMCSLVARAFPDMSEGRRPEAPADPWKEPTFGELMDMNDNRTITGTERI